MKKQNTTLKQEIKEYKEIEKAVKQAFKDADKYADNYIKFASSKSTSGWSLK